MRMSVISQQFAQKVGMLANITGAIIWWSPFKVVHRVPGMGPVFLTPM